MAAHRRATVTIQRVKDGLRGRETMTCAEWNGPGLQKLSFLLDFLVFTHQKSVTLPTPLPRPFTAQKSDLKCFHQVPVVSTWPSMRISTEVWMPYQWETASSPSSPPSARRRRPCRSCCSPSSRTWPVDIWADRSASHWDLLTQAVCYYATLMWYLRCVCLLAVFLHPFQGCLSTCQLSEPLLWFILRVLDTSEALKAFHDMGRLYKPKADLLPVFVS